MFICHLSSSIKVYWTLIFRYCTHIVDPHVQVLHLFSNGFNTEEDINIYDPNHIIILANFFYCH